ncbi:DUF3515 family protein [Nesterenkonia salmonea]|uniref:DUF3515 family protein n=1 Tax=Nesterenkonia salmonea TaxID=1804987 RepID=A0A5R9BE05_9MICC|nr:DUF3515 family protein [Nesterenkonia salmonea]
MYAASAALLGLTGCASTSSVEPAPEAHHPDCAEVMLTLPEQVGEYEQRRTTSQATAAWGDPAAVVLRCGVEPIGPTEHPCVSPAGVDWVWIEHEDHSQLISFGREPSVELLLDQDYISESSMMDVQAALSGPVQEIEQVRECLPIDQAEALGAEGADSASE